MRLGIAIPSPSQCGTDVGLAIVAGFSNVFTSMSLIISYTTFFLKSPLMMGKACSKKRVPIEWHMMERVVMPLFLML